MGFKNIRGIPHYKVHWLGYSSRHDTWEPADNLAACGGLVAEYHSRTSAAAKEGKITKKVRLQCSMHKLSTLHS